MPVLENGRRGRGEKGNREGKRQDLRSGAVEREGEGSKTWRTVTRETNREKR